MEKIKVKACTMTYLEILIEFWKKYNYVTKIIRPARWYEFPYDFVAIMEHQEK